MRDSNSTKNTISVGKSLKRFLDSFIDKKLICTDCTSANQFVDCGFLFVVNCKFVLCVFVVDIDQFYSRVIILNKISVSAAIESDNTIYCY